MADFALNDFLPYQIAVLATRVSREFSSHYSARFGLSVPEWRVIFHLYTAGTVSVREVFHRVDMDKSKVSRAGTRLEQAGLITKRTNPSDRRLLEMSLTDEGRAVMEGILPLALSFQETLKDKLGEDADAFCRGMLVLLEHFEEEEA